MIYKCICGEEFENRFKYSGHCVGCKIRKEDIQNNPQNYKIKDHKYVSQYKLRSSLNCIYCNKLCTNINSLSQHEIRCKLNENRIISGNKGNMPEHTNVWLKSNVIRNNDILNITNEELENYKNTHKVCEICGRTVEEATKWKSKYAPKNLCVDHNHITLKFRGLLCSLCNRQLGWYEKYKFEIDTYLNKDNK